MRELLQQVLTDTSMRDSQALTTKVAVMTGEFLPWLNE